MNIRKYRIRKGMSQKDLAQALNVYQSTVSQWERGITNPRVTKLGIIAETLGCTIPELIDGKKERTHHASNA